MTVSSPTGNLASGNLSSAERVGGSAAGDPLDDAGCPHNCGSHQAEEVAVDGEILHFWRCNGCDGYDCDIILAGPR